MSVLEKHCGDCIHKPTCRIRHDVEVVIIKHWDLLDSERTEPMKPNHHHHIGKMLGSMCSLHKTGQEGKD
jgi:hypothetical protein